MPLDRLGLIKTSLLDFPNLVAAVLFTPGCNLRCPWCQNPELVKKPYASDLIPKDQILSLLERRQKVLQGVVVTGGEPLYHQDLKFFLSEVKSLGYKIKLDTNGTYPVRLKELGKDVVDYVAMDVKNLPELYELSAGVPVSGQKLRASIDWIRETYAERSEFRLTWVPGLNQEKDISGIAAFLGPGAKLYVQGFRSGTTLDSRWSSARSATNDEIVAVAQAFQNAGIDAAVRNSI